MADVDCLIFSKDRPAQLDLLLRSINRHAAHVFRALTVLVKATTEKYARGYDKLTLTGFDSWWNETTFESDVRAWLALAGDRVGFLCDDDVFYRYATRWPIDSYRLGSNVRYCYPLDHAQTPPNHVRWRWRDFDGDWGYPLALDGHVYEKSELLPLFDFSFADPNQLEAGLAARADRFPREWLTCAPYSSLVSIMANRVNTSVPNRHRGHPDETPEALNERFLAGDRMDLLALDFSNVNACHIETPIVWESARVRA